MNRIAFGLPLLVLLLGFVACEGGRVANPAEVKATENMEGKTITIRGTAENRKNGAVAGNYFVGDLSSWPEDIVGKQVEATGRLRIIEHSTENLVNSKGEYSQGMVGKQYILEKATWKVVE